MNVNRTISQDFKDIKKDFLYVFKLYGDSYEFDGSVMEKQHLARMLESPTKATAYYCYLERLAAIFEKGYKDKSFRRKQLPIDQDEALYQIAVEHSFLKLVEKNTVPVGVPVPRKPPALRVVQNT